MYQINAYIIFLIFVLLIIIYYLIYLTLYLLFNLPAQNPLPAPDRITTLQSGFIDNPSKHSLNSLNENP